MITDLCFSVNLHKNITNSSFFKRLVNLIHHFVHSEALFYNCNPLFSFYSSFDTEAVESAPQDIHTSSEVKKSHRSSYLRQNI